MFSGDRTPRAIQLLRQRELKELGARDVAWNLHVTDNLITRLGLEHELEGHKGCVNCLEWNETGQILASASDDRHVILWDPFRYEKKTTIGTGHHGNIFSVKFMPETNDTLLVTGAADCYVCMHDLSASKPVLACSCHKGRVKRIATARGVPFLFWTAGEDGLILQYDARMPHACPSTSGPNVLIDLTAHLGRYAEAKCIDVNTQRPELIAVGANDAFVRIYDRRMIKPSTLQVNVEDSTSPVDQERSGSWQRRAWDGDSEDNIPLGCARYYIAGHLKPGRRTEKRNRSLAATYLTFSADGNELLVNMGGEQIYLFNINDSRSCSKFIVPNTLRKKCPETTAVSADAVHRDQSHVNCSREGSQLDEATEGSKKQDDGCLLPPNAEALKQEANEAFQNRKYMTAIQLYNKALAIFPVGAVLYANRAAVLMKRAWDGDIYAALRDCEMTIALDPYHVKAHFRLARCLYDLNRPTEAYEAICNFQKKFPEYSRNSACRALCKDIKETLNSGQETPNDEANHQGISVYERYWRDNCADYEVRFSGHCNTTTDIKEANFFGSLGQYIVAGSDDGSFFIWDRKTTNILRVLNGDASIVNCLQPHPSTCLLATSGIDPVIRLWSPLPEDGSSNERNVLNLEEAVIANQARMDSDPFELMLRSMGYRFWVEQSENEGENRDDGEGRSAPDDDAVTRPLNCRQS